MLTAKKAGRGLKMVRTKRPPVVLATTALWIVRNMISERLYRTREVSISPISDDESYSQLRFPHARSERIKGVGVIGDSLSDEYRFHAPHRITARNWVEILAATRGLSFGEPEIDSGRAIQERRFSYNWSRSGATTTSLIDQGQLKGLMAQVAGGSAINLAAVTVGTNDFAAVLVRSRSAAAMDRAVERASSNVETILDSLLSIDPSLKIAVFNAVDLRRSPLLRRAYELGLISSRLAEAYGRAVADFNGRLRGLIAPRERRVVGVDINQLLFEIVEATSYSIGGHEIERGEASDDGRHLFLGDGFHPGTIGQCLIANQFLDAINDRFGADVELLSEEEMIRVATSVPKPSGLSLFGTGVLAQFGYRRRPARGA
jgi:hypothetical protein